MVKVLVDFCVGVVYLQNSENKAVHEYYAAEEVEERDKISYRSRTAQNKLSYMFRYPKMINHP